MTAGAPPKRPGPPGWIGLLLAIPMVVGWAYWLVLPTFSTLLHSVIGYHNSFAIEPESFAGTGGALVRTLVVALVPTLVMLIVVPLLSFAAATTGTMLRTAIRVVLVVPVAGFAPAIAAAAWQSLTLSPPLDWLRPDGTGSELALTALISGLASFGLVCGIGVSILLSALRRRRDDSAARPLGAAAVVWAVLVLGTLALSMQDLTLLYAPSAAGSSHRTLPIQIYVEAFEEFQTGAGAGASAVLLVPVALLGLAAGLVLIVSRARIELDRDRTTGGLLPPALGRSLGTVLGVVALAVTVVVVVLFELLPRLGILRSSHESAGFGTTIVYAVLPGVLTTIVQLVLAYPAGIGIGAFRPLGRHSHWLLLPFVPWLFVTLTPLMISAYQSAANGHRLDGVLGQVSPILVSVPALVVFTLFAAGQGEHWRADIQRGRPAAAAFGRTVVLPSLPLVALVGMATLLYETHSVVWKLLAGGSHVSGPLLPLIQLGKLDKPNLAQLVSAAPFAVPALIVFVTLTVLYLDRLTVRIGGLPGSGTAGSWSGPHQPGQLGHDDRPGR